MKNPYTRVRYALQSDCFGLKKGSLFEEKEGHGVFIGDGINKYGSMIVPKEWLYNTTYFKEKYFCYCCDMPEGFHQGGCTANYRSEKERIENLENKVEKMEAELDRKYHEQAGFETRYPIYFSTEQEMHDALNLISTLRKFKMFCIAKYRRNIRLGFYSIERKTKIDELIQILDKFTQKSF